MILIYDYLAIASSSVVYKFHLLMLYGYEAQMHIKKN